MRLNSVDKQVEELSQKLSKLSSKYENLLERLSAIETETTKEENKIQDDFEVEVEEVSQALPKWAADLDSDYLQLPEEFSNKFQMIGEKYYYIENKDKLNWFDARAECSIMNSHLVSLQNVDEWNAIRAHLDPFESYWVDIKESRSEANFLSETTPNKPPLLMWYTSEPNNLATSISNEDCVELRSQYNHFMNDISCYNENYYVCETYPPSSW